MSQNFLDNIFSRGAFARTDSPLVSVGGVSSNSATLTYDVLHFDATGNLLVNAALGGGGAGGAVSQSGSWTVAVSQGTMSVLWAQRLDATNDAILAYGQARTNDIAPAVTNGSNTPIITDSLGKIVVLPGAVGDQHLTGAVSNIASTASQTLIATPGVGRRIALQSLLVTASGSAPVQITISGGPNNRTLGILQPTGGWSQNAGGAPLYITSASTVLLIVSNATSSYWAYASGYAMSN